MSGHVFTAVPRSPMNSRQLLATTVSMTGAACATSARVRFRRSMLPQEWLGMKISTSTVPGSEVPTYGHIWRPRQLMVGWAPYRYGHWAYIGPWGWTWVDDAPWGYAPFHYGRWVNYGGYWGWAPGPRYIRPGLRSRIGDLVWRCRLGRWHRLRRWLRIRLVSAGLGRTLLSLVSLQPRILRSSEHQQHANHQCLQLLRPGW